MLFYKFMASMPVILLALYYFPFLGVCLLLFRCFYYKSKRYKTSLFLVIAGLLLFLPNCVSSILKLGNITAEWTVSLNTFIASDVYLKILNYAKFLLYLGVIFLILSYVFFYFFSKIKNKAESYIKADLNKDYEIRKENDLKMQIKREQAKNTHVVKCPYCGSDNMLTENIGTCAYCRRKIEYK